MLVDLHQVQGAGRLLAGRDHGCGYYGTCGNITCRKFHRTAAIVSLQVRRAHLVDATVDGGLLLELYSPEGAHNAAMISSDFYQVRYFHILTCDLKIAARAWGLFLPYPLFWEAPCKNAGHMELRHRLTEPPCCRRRGAISTSSIFIASPEACAHDNCPGLAQPASNHAATLRCTGLGFPGVSRTDLCISVCREPPPHGGQVPAAGIVVSGLPDSCSITMDMAEDACEVTFSPASKQHIKPISKRSGRQKPQASKHSDRRG